MNGEMEQMEKDDDRGQTEEKIFPGRVPSEVVEHDVTSCLATVIGSP